VRNFSTLWCTLGVTNKEVRLVRNERTRCLLLVGLMLSVVVLGSVAAAASVQSLRYKLGEPVVFMIEDEKTSRWCCCCCSGCPDTLILGWRIVAASGATVYSLRFDPVGYASDWDGTWHQTDASGAPVPAGSYTLYVDTSAGTLSRCFSLYDPCSGCCCWNWCSTRSYCTCRQVATITHSCCRTSLVLVQEERNRCSFRLFWPCCP